MATVATQAPLGIRPSSVVHNTHVRRNGGGMGGDFEIGGAYDDAENASGKDGGADGADETPACEAARGTVDAMSMSSSNSVGIHGLRPPFITAIVAMSAARQALSRFTMLVPIPMPIMPPWVVRARKPPDLGWPVPRQRRTTTSSSGGSNSYVGLPSRAFRTSAEPSVKPTQSSTDSQWTQMMGLSVLGSIKAATWWPSVGHGGAAASAITSASAPRVHPRGRGSLESDAA